MLDLPDWIHTALHVKNWAMLAAVVIFVIAKLAHDRRQAGAGDDQDGVGTNGPARP